MPSETLNPKRPPPPPQELDLCTMRSEDQDFTAEFSLPAQSTSECVALALWFDTDFSERHCRQHPVKLTTSPHSPVTHWAQTILLLKAPLLLQPVDVTGGVGGGGGGSAAPGDGRATASAITCRLSMVRSCLKHRSMDISLEYGADMSDGSRVKEAVIYHMNVTSES